MGYYIKITGRGYLKHIDTSYDYNSMFSKQLTLSYCGDTYDEAEAFRTKIENWLNRKVAKKKASHDAVLKVITFPEMYTCKSAKAYLKKQGVDVDNYYINNAFRTGMDITGAVEWLRDKFEWYWEEPYKSAVAHAKLVSKGKIVELENLDVRHNATHVKDAGWVVAANKDTDSYQCTHYCNKCGANIPGAKYFMVYGAKLCPYCLRELADVAKDSVKQLGPEMEKEYKKVLFVKNL